MIIRHAQWMEDNRWHEGDIRLGWNVFPESIDASHALAYPGLVNAHDHLEMNLYWQLGRPPYDNYTQWTNDVYQPDDPWIRRIQSVPLIDRLRWGALKNLLSGVATVFHHNPYYRRYMWRLPVDVLRKYQWHHSLALAGSVERQQSDRPFFIHAGEGIDGLASDEVTELDRRGLLNGRTILIHAVHLSEEMIGRIHATRTPVVWCPSSNHFLFGQTAPVDRLDQSLVALGTDSTMTGAVTLFDEMRVALTHGISPGVILNMVTQNPRRMIKRPIESLSDCPASLLLVHRKENDYAANLIHSTTEDIECVIVRGRIRVASLEISRQLKLKPNLVFNGTPLWVDMDVRPLLHRLHQRLGDPLGRHPLWQRLQAHRQKVQAVHV